MSSGDGGGDIFGSLNLGSVVKGEGNFFENFLNGAVNLGVQSATAGYLGYNDGKIGNGVSTDFLKTGGKATVKGLKDVTGATAAEEANALAREQFEKSQVDIINQRNENIKQVGRDQVRQSMLAGSARNAGRTSGSFSLGGDERDFLGL